MSLYDSCIKHCAVAYDICFYATHICISSTHFFVHIIDAEHYFSKAPFSLYDLKGSDLEKKSNQCNLLGSFNIQLITLLT